MRFSEVRKSIILKTFYSKRMFPAGVSLTFYSLLASHLCLSLSNLWRETDVVNDKLSKEILRLFSSLICQGNTRPWVHLGALLAMKIIDCNGLWPGNGPGWDVVSCSERCANYSRYINVSFCSPPYHHLISAIHPLLSDTQPSQGKDQHWALEFQERICYSQLWSSVWKDQFDNNDQLLTWFPTTNRRKYALLVDVNGIFAGGRRMFCVASSFGPFVCKLSNYAVAQCRKSSGNAQY